VAETPAPKSPLDDEPTSEESGEERDERRPKIAVVDDDRNVREALADYLSTEGFDVIVAPNGLRLVSALQVDRPDAILLDVVMSWIDGVELCRALKRNPLFRDIPVVLISGHDRADLERAEDAGAVAYFRKPLDLPALTEELRAITGMDASPGV
jgi:CheY-like chemotaxis protein